MNFLGKYITVILALLLAVLFGIGALLETQGGGAQSVAEQSSEQQSYIKWFEFDVTSQALSDAYQLDVKSQQEEVVLDWIELLACLGVKYGGDFDRYKASDLQQLAEQIRSGKQPEDLTANQKYYNYYLEGYRNVLGGMVGHYEIETETESGRQMERKYGLKAFSPIAKGYGFSHYDDFGNSRSYGFARKHLGNDLMGSVGTPIVAVESGVVEALGWNQYGGWRVGIRSADSGRYYYYAHLRKDRPYAKDLAVGQTVTAGDVIGYLGMSGYSTKENTNNINVPHLHFGIQLIFDESQKEANSEIWIDAYHIVEFLQKNKSAVTKDAETGEYHRTYQMRDPTLYE